VRVRLVFVYVGSVQLERGVRVHLVSVPGGGDVGGDGGVLRQRIAISDKV
jgi:hypothetical protein